jgi:glutathionylspermidine synthase
MQRLTSTPRPGWERTVESQGLIYHHTANGVYWDESVCYQFTAREIDGLEAATNELQARCLDAAQHVIDHNRFAEFGIPPAAVPAITWAWENEPPAIYGRFDLIYDGRTPPKLLEYNADTPTALIEASIAQWYWKEDVRKGTDQFNSIHERLVAKWKELKDYLTGEVLHFAALPEQQGEDLMTSTYMRDTAIEAGLTTEALLVGDIGWDPDAHEFVDLQQRTIESIFKLYPWEWMVWEEFGTHALDTYQRVQWIEPIWKMLWSNKAILAVLWELFPNHPNLVAAYLDAPRELTSYVKKPKMSREGANVSVVVEERRVAETGGDYGEEGFVFQQFVAPVNDQHPIIGSWVIDGVSAGMGIRESSALVTDNLSRFVPHFFE